MTAEALSELLGIGEPHLASGVAATPASGDAAPARSQDWLVAALDARTLRRSAFIPGAAQHSVVLPRDLKRQGRPD